MKSKKEKTKEIIKELEELRFNLTIIMSTEESRANSLIESICIESKQLQEELESTAL